MSNLAVLNIETKKCRVCCEELEAVLNYLKLGG